MPKNISFTIGLLFLCLQAPSTSGSDSPMYWPQFRGPDRTGVSASKGLLTEWPEEGPPLVWQAEGAGRGYSSVSIADGRLFTMGDGPSTADDEDEYLLCFDVTSGQQLWKARLGQAWDEGPDDWQSSRSTPTIDGDRVYALTAHGDLVCARTDDGHELWRKNLKADFGGKKGDGWGYSESVLIDGDRLICTPGGTKRTMVALDKRSGDLIWSTVRDRDRGAGHASVLPSNVAGIRVYVQTTASGALAVCAHDGTLMWSYGIDETTAVIPSPIILDDLVFFAAGYGRGGALLRQVPNGDSAVKIEEIYPLNEKLANKHGGIVKVGEEIFGDSGDSGSPFCANFMTGKRHWKKRGGGRGSAAIVAADGHFYILFSNSKMVLARATSEDYQEVSSFEVPGDGERPSWAHPVVAGERLFLRMDDRILCYDLLAQ